MLIALEGIDGAGKQTQARLLVDKSQAAGLSVGCLSFPRYGETVAAAAVRAYLDGRFGALEDIDPQLAALLFATDRFESRELIWALDEQLDVLVLDRYVASNIAHQASRVAVDRRPALKQWLAQIEYEVFALPRADLTVLIDLAPDAAQRAICERHIGTPDIHESDLEYLRSCRELYLELSQDPTWRVIPVADARGRRHTPEAVADLVWRAVDEARASAASVSSS